MKENVCVKERGGEGSGGTTEDKVRSRDLIKLYITIRLPNDSE
jgi:hypothetical protein